jgi:uncharacterized protein (TIGR02598 family)
MKPFFHRRKSRARGGFSLVEATFSIGLLSCGFLTLAPLLAVGMKTSRLARDDRATEQIAQTLVEEARQGTLPASPVYLDDQGTACPAAQAAYLVQTTTDSPTPALTRLALRVTPVGAPERARIYAVVFPTQN